MTADQQKLLSLDDKSNLTIDYSKFQEPFQGIVKVNTAYGLPIEKAFWVVNKREFTKEVGLCKL